MSLRNAALLTCLAGAVFAAAAGLAAEPAPEPSGEPAPEPTRMPAEIPPEKSAALGEAWKKLGLPAGADFFLSFRKYIAEHTDTFVMGPTSAADYLATRKKP